MHVLYIHALIYHIGGVVCMSGYLANAAKWKISAAGVKTKLGMFHGKADPVVKLIWGKFKNSIQ